MVRFCSISVPESAFVDNGVVRGLRRSGLCPFNLDPLGVPRNPLLAVHFPLSAVPGEARQRARVPCTPCPGAETAQTSQVQVLVPPRPWSAPSPGSQMPLLPRSIGSGHLWANVFSATGGPPHVPCTPALDTGPPPPTLQSAQVNLMPGFLSNEQPSVSQGAGATGSGVPPCQATLLLASRSKEPYVSSHLAGPGKGARM